MMVLSIISLNTAGSQVLQACATPEPVTLPATRERANVDDRYGNDHVPQRCNRACSGRGRACTGASHANGKPISSTHSSPTPMLNTRPTNKGYAVMHQFLLPTHLSEGLQHGTVLQMGASQRQGLQKIWS